MRPKLILPVLFSFLLSARAQGQSGEGAQLLFRNVTTRLSATDKENIFQKLGFRLSKDKKEFTSPEDQAGENPFAVTVYPTDLNRDGIEEVFIIYGNTFTSGATGSSVALFLKSAAGYVENLNLPAAPPMVLPTKNQGYPDLILGGPGRIQPVYRWNGKKYAFYKKIKDENLNGIKVSGIEEWSRQYTNSTRR